ncbi:MAG TPA: peptidase M48 [Methylophilaceae bacterium]|nr:peptidase M48 [Methylophilaceae bacterium]
MNSNYKISIIAIMKLKTIVIAMLLWSPTFTLADEGVFTGKPYTPSTNVESNLPDLGDVSQTVLSQQDERRIGEQILREVATSDEVLQDAEVTDYLQALGDRLATNGPDKQQKFTFFVVKDKSINAFAMPGGVIGVHTGLFLAVNSESELASVLGHEIGHVTQHHLARMLASQKYDTFKNIAGIALALLVSRSNPQLASGALTAASATTIQRQLDYTREHEREADRVGLSILDNTGFDVRAMPAFFNTLQRGTRFVEGTAPSFLRTHPLTSERIADVSNRVQNMTYRQVEDSLEFHLVRAKVRAMQSFPQTAIDEFEDNIKQQRFNNEVAEHYGLAIAYLRKNDVENAVKQWQWLKTQGSQHAFLDNLAANIEIARHQPKKAELLYTQSLSRFPASRALIYGAAENYLASRQPDKAIEVIERKLPLLPNDANCYDLLAKAYTVKGKVLLKHQAQAEAYYRKFDINHAVEQMEFAAKASDGNFYEKSIVEARLKELRRLQDIEKEAKKNA